MKFNLNESRMFANKDCTTIVRVFVHQGRAELAMREHVWDEWRPTVHLQEIAVEAAKESTK